MKFSSANTPVYFICRADSRPDVGSRAVTASAPHLSPDPPSTPADGTVPPQAPRSALQRPSGLHPHGTPASPRSGTTGARRGPLAPRTTAKLGPCSRGTPGQRHRAQRPRRPHSDPPRPRRPHSDHQDPASPPGPTPGRPAAPQLPAPPGPDTPGRGNPPPAFTARRGPSTAAKALPLPPGRVLGLLPRGEPEPGAQVPAPAPARGRLPSGPAAAKPLHRAPWGRAASVRPLTPGSMPTVPPGLSHTYLM